MTFQRCSQVPRRRFLYLAVPVRYCSQITPDQIELAAWSSYARLLLTVTEFLYVD